MTARLIPALADHELAFAVGALAPPEREAMAEIADTADPFTAAGRSWLLVPASPWQPDTLAAFGAGAEDRQPGLDDEPEHDTEPDCDMEPDDPAEEDAPEASRPLADARGRPRKPGINYGSDRNYWRALSL